VSVDPGGGVIPRIQRVVRDADAFLGFLQRGNLHPQYHRNSQWEIDGARTVCDLVDSLRSLEDVDLPVRARVGMGPLRRLLFALIERWNWDRVIGRGGEAFLSEQEELRDKKRRSYYGAIRSHVEAFAARQISKRPDDGYFNMATTAELEGIPPTMPPVLMVEDLESLGKAWIHSPYVASEFPTLNEGEYLAIEIAIRDFRDAIREQCALQPALIEASRSAEEELIEARRCDPLPKPGCLTVGEMIDALRVQAMVYPAIGTSKIVFEQWNRREELLEASIGFREFRSWCACAR